LWYLHRNLIFGCFNFLKTNNIWFACCNHSINLLKWSDSVYVVWNILMFILSWKKLSESTFYFINYIGWMYPNVTKKVELMEKIEKMEFCYLVSLL
jgi:uncharacterized membrane-anchored protein YitT (DUF2179 family)